MRYAITILLCMMTSCAADQPVTAETSQAALYCTDGGGRIACYPDAAWENWRCDDLCIASGFNEGYCPNYNQAEFNHCIQYCLVDTVSCDDNCRPQLPHQCVAGHQL